MYFLKCEYCGFKNPIKTEYLTFCENCGKKLPENFNDWKKQHPSGSFEDFKINAGQKHSQEHSLKRHHRSPLGKRNIRFALIPVITVLLLIGAGGMIYLMTITRDLSELFLPRFLNETKLSGKWDRYHYGKYGLSLSTPEKFREDKIKIPVNYKDRIQDMESFSWHPAKGFRIFIVNVLYREKIPVNLRQVATGTITELVSRPGVTNVEYRQSPVMYDNVDGLMLEGNFHENQVFLRFQSVLYVRRSNAWTVTVIYNDSDPTGKEVAERVMESIEINYFGVII